MCVWGGGMYVLSKCCARQGRDRGERQREKERERERKREKERERERGREREVIQEHHRNHSPIA